MEEPSAAEQPVVDVPVPKAKAPKKKPAGEAKLLKVRLGAKFGATMQVAGYNFAKPRAEAHITFKGMPTDKQVDAAWDWMWEHSIEPQLQDLIESVKKNMRDLPQNILTEQSEKARSDDWSDGSSSSAGRPIESIPDAPAGEAY